MGGFILSITTTCENHAIGNETGLIMNELIWLKKQLSFKNLFRILSIILVEGIFVNNYFFKKNYAC